MDSELFPRNMKLFKSLQDCPISDTLPRVV